MLVEDQRVGAKNQDGCKQRVNAAAMRPARDRCHSDDDATSASASSLASFTAARHYQL